MSKDERIKSIYKDLISFMSKVQMYDTDEVRQSQLLIQKELNQENNAAECTFLRAALTFMEAVGDRPTFQQ
jgi:hypothetical protein